jgi:hypothetical protein
VEFPRALTYPVDIFGQRTGTFAQWPSQNWTGWNVYWSEVAGQRLNMGGASAYIDHADAVGRVAQILIFNVCGQRS